MTTDREQDFELLRESTVQAADLALSFWGKPIQKERKADGTAVTAADRAVDDLFAQRLRGSRPHYGWLSEESAEQEARVGVSRVWVIDPIDGTRDFIRGRSDWTVGAALVEDSAPVLAVLINPVREQVFEARASEGAYLNGRRLHVSRQSNLSGARLTVPEAIIRRQADVSVWENVVAIKANSTLYRFALVACGQADATFALTSKWEWDVAAGALLVAEAGGTVTDALGNKLKFNSWEAKVHGYIASSPKLHQILLDRLKTG
jgi:myo-inositol-1(or 4)-monophosphatase